MKCLSSFAELDVLGEGLVKDYIQRSGRKEISCVDIEGFLIEYLGLSVVYESFAEEDASKIGFLANGQTPLEVYRNGAVKMVVFPCDTVVVDQYLLRGEESSRRRFTLAHEAAHKILEQHIPMQTVACFHSDFDGTADYSQRDLSRIFSLNETCANRLGAAIVMPRFLVEKALRKFNGGEPVKYYSGGVFGQKEKLTIQRMADELGASFSAMTNRLREFRLLEERPLEEYIKKELCFGGNLK